MCRRGTSRCPAFLQGAAANSAVLISVPEISAPPTLALWQPIVAYLDLVKLLVPTQDVVTAPKLIAMTKRSLGYTMPLTLDGLCQGLSEHGLTKPK